MKITIAYRLSASYRDAQARAGNLLPAEGTVEVEVEIAELLDRGWQRLQDSGQMAPALLSGDGLLRNHSGGFYLGQPEFDGPPSPEAALAALRALDDARVAGLARRAEAEEAARQERERDAEAERQRDAERGSSYAALLNRYLAGEVGVWLLRGGETLTDGATDVYHARTYEKAKPDIQAEATRRRLEPVVAWVEAHGSERLRLAVSTSEISNCLAVYRDERLALERPGWQWDDGAAEAERLNAAEAELRALAEARQTDPEVRLVSNEIQVQEEGEYGDRETVHRPALASTFLERGIVRYLDR